MIVSELLSSLREKGIELRLDSERLVCDAPKDAMTPEILTLLKQKKNEITAFLKQGQISSWSPLVAIRDSGSKAPFFCFHGVGGNVLNYANFLNYLDKAQPLYGLQSKGLDGKSMPLSTIEEMARYYLNEIRSVQPRGPYFLGGGSMGGLIAFEAAQQLLFSGEKVGLLIMFDTLGPDSMRSRVFRSARRRQLVDKLFKTSLNEKWAFFRRKIKGRLEKNNKIQACLNLLENHQTLPHDLRLWFVETMNYRAIAGYKTQSYSEEIVLIKGDDEKEGVYSDPARGWKRIARNLRILSVPGRHETLIEEPQLCHAFVQCLEKAQAANGYA